MSGPREEFLRKRIQSEIKRLGNPIIVVRSDFEHFRYAKNSDVSFLRILNDELSSAGYVKVCEVAKDMLKIDRDIFNYGYVLEETLED